MAYVATPKGHRLYYEHHLPEGVPRTTVIFSCAYCTTHENWRGQVEPLVAAGYAVVLLSISTPCIRAQFSMHCKGKGVHGLLDQQCRSEGMDWQDQPSILLSWSAEDYQNGPGRLLL